MKRRHTALHSIEISNMINDTSYSPNIVPKLIQCDTDVRKHVSDSMHSLSNLYKHVMSLKRYEQAKALRKLLADLRTWAANTPWEEPPARGGQPLGPAESSNPPIVRKRTIRT